MFLNVPLLASVNGCVSKCERGVQAQLDSLGMGAQAKRY